MSTTNGTPIDRRPYTDAEMAGLETAAVLAWFVHWASHRRANCQCARLHEEDAEHGRRAADALSRLGRLMPEEEGLLRLADLPIEMWSDG